MDELDKILFNPKRFIIAIILYLHGPITMSELQKATGLTWGDLDSNIRRLREANYVETRKTLTLKGPRTLVALTAKGRMRLEKLMDQLENLLQEARAAQSTRDSARDTIPGENKSMF